MQPVRGFSAAGGKHLFLSSIVSVYSPAASAPGSGWWYVFRLIILDPIRVFSQQYPSASSSGKGTLGQAFNSELSKKICVHKRLGVGIPL